MSIANEYNNLNFLAVEDEDLEFTLLQHALKSAWKSNFSLIRVASAKEAVEYMHRLRIDVIFLDLNVKDTKGLQTVQTVVQHNENRSIIIVTTSVNDKKMAVESLKLGAQDYLIKGEYSAESLSRALLHALARNEQTLAQKQPQGFLEIEGLKIDLLRQKLINTVKHAETDLTSNEVKLLSFLMNNLNSTVNRETIVEKVVGLGIAVSERAVDNQVSRLRAKLEGTSYSIDAVRGIGYSFKKNQ